MEICFNDLGKMYYRGSRGVKAEVEKAEELLKTFWRCS